MQVAAGGWVERGMRLFGAGYQLCMSVTYLDSYAIKSELRGSLETSHGIQQMRKVPTYDWIEGKEIIE
jgi:hypothetical protein